MKKPCPHRLLLIATAAGMLGCAARPAEAQYVNPAQQDAVIQQDAANGVLSPGQAANLINRENGLAAREARLLRNDGGVLTPHDAAKLAREQAQNNAALNADVMNNSHPGFFNSLFGARSAYPVVPTGYPVAPYTYPAVPATPVVYPTAPVMTPTVVTPAVVPTPVVAPPAHWHHRRWDRDHWIYY